MVILADPFLITKQTECIHFLWVLNNRKKCLALISGTFNGSLKAGRRCRAYIYRFESLRQIIHRTLTITPFYCRFDIA
jgi:hypothetical protein